MRSRSTSSSNLRLPGPARTLLVGAGVFFFLASTAPAALAFGLADGPATPAKSSAPAGPADGDLYLSIFINGVSRDIVVAVHQEADGSLAIAPDQLLNVGLLPNDAAKLPDGRIGLALLPDVTYVLDESQQSLLLAAPDTSRARLIIAADGSDPTVPRDTSAPEGKPGMFGALLNYDIYDSATYTDGDAGIVTSPVSGSFEARVFGPFGLIDQTFSALSSPLQVRRLNTTWSYSDPDAMRTYRVGDIVTSALSWTRPTRLGGVQIQNDFGLRSDIITYPVPDLSGSAALPSAVEVYVNNANRYTGTVPAGPFDIVDLPITTGAGTVEVVVRDANGKEVVTKADYFASQRLLKPGLSDYSAELGFARTHFATDQDTYDPRLMGSASLRTGVTDWLTWEGHAEGGLDLLNVGMGTVFALGQLGIGQFSAEASRTPDAIGAQLTGSLQVAFGAVTLGARAQRSFGRYEDIASLTQPAIAGIDRSAPTPHAIYQLSLSVPTPFDSSRVNLSYTQVEPVYGEISQIVAAGYGRPLFAGSISASAYLDLKSRNYGLMASLWMPLGAELSTGASVQNGPSGTAVTADLTHSGGNQVGDVGWLVRVRQDTHTSWSASARTKLPAATLHARLAHAGTQTAASGELSGAIVVADGGVFFSNPVNDAFAIVDVGTGAVPVLFQNRVVGKTGKDGKLLVPNLLSYEKNRIAIDPTNLPLDRVVQNTRTIVVPADRAGVVVTFADSAAKGGAALVSFRDASGALIELGTTGTGAGIPDFMVGYDGEALLEGLGADNRVTLTRTDGSLCDASVPYAAKGGAQVLIPDIVCRPQ